MRIFGHILKRVYINICLIYVEVHTQISLIYIYIYIYIRGDMGQYIKQKKIPFVALNPLRDTIMIGIFI